jgi:hypothetical protein
VLVSLMRVVLVRLKVVVRVVTGSIQAESPSEGGKRACSGAMGAGEDDDGAAGIDTSESVEEI